MPGKSERKNWSSRQKSWRLPGILLALLIAVGGLLALVITVPPVVIRSSRPDIQTASAADQLKAENDLRGTLVTMLAGAAVAAGTVVAALNFRETRRQNRESSELQRRGQVTERFSKAVEQLGDDKMDIRVGGIYGLEQIARDSPDLHWPIVEVLAAFIREHAKRVVPGGTTGQVTSDTQAALTVLGRRDPSRDPIWDRGRLELGRTNLQEADLEWAELQGAILPGVNLRGAKLQGAKLNEANLQEANLGEANLQSADLSGANLQGADLANAKLQRVNLAQANLQGAVGLTQEQFDSTICDEETKPPLGLTIKVSDPDQSRTS